MRQLLVTLFAFITIQLNAQSNFLGLSLGNGNGVISKYDALNNILTAPYSFENPGTGPVDAEFIEGNDGKLYSTTKFGGIYNKGVLFSYDPENNVYTKLQDLTSVPTGVLTYGKETMIYGLTTNQIFSYNISTGIYSLLYTFHEANGIDPKDGLTMADDGKFYGITQQGGHYDWGVIFSFDTLTDTYTKLLDLQEIHGSSSCGLTLGPDSKLYGTTIGGLSYAGLLFSYQPSTGIFDFEHHFNAVTGDFPVERLTLANNGKLYGVTLDASLNPGVIYSYDPLTDIYLHHFEFDHISGGRYSKALTQGTDGKLYGVSDAGFDGEKGVVFSFDPGTEVFVKLHDFDFNDGSTPMGKLCEASNGKMYGMAENMLIDDNHGEGRIFSYEPVTDFFAVLHEFELQKGVGPHNGLVKGSGNLYYGVTASGGVFDKGVLFSFNADSYNYTKIYDFNGLDGEMPLCGLIEAPNGKFYGTTSRGGINNEGVLFSFDPATNTVENHFEFNEIDGSTPAGELIPGDNGKLYGMAWGGAHDMGVIFSFDPTNDTYAKLYDFTFSDGGDPYGGFTKAADGKFYALLRLGGAHFSGSIISFDPSLNQFSKLHDFNFTNGRFPYGKLLLATDGKLYGLTSGGGTVDGGILFSFNPATNSLENLHEFEGATGTIPKGSLVQDNDGKLYGITSTGGANDLGVIFSYDITTDTYSKLQDFDGLNGGNPQYGALLKLETPIGSPLPVKYLVFNASCESNSTLLRWSTAMEVNSRYFDIEKSSDGSSWKIIGTVPASGNSTDINHYSSRDAEANNENSLYRIREMDHDGSYTYSNIIQSNCKSGNQVFLSPNPTRDQVTINLSSVTSAKIKIAVYDSRGRKVKEVPATIFSGMNQVQIDLRELADGMYLIKIDGSGDMEGMRLIKD